MDKNESVITGENFIEIRDFKPGGDCENGDGEEESWRPKSSLEAEPFPGKAGQLLCILTQGLYWTKLLIFGHFTLLAIVS